MKINSQTPFTTRTQIAAQGIHGSFDQRNMSINGPLKEHGEPHYDSSIIDASAMATSLLGPDTGVVQNFKKNSDAIIANPNLAAVTANAQNSTGFENPAATVTEPEYPFMDDPTNISGGTDFSANLRNDPNRNNFFGTWKRTEGSFDERIKQATADGKYNKVKRLNEKRDNFRANNIANKPPEES